MLHLLDLESSRDSKSKKERREKRRGQRITEWKNKAFYGVILRETEYCVMDKFSYRYNIVFYVIPRKNNVKYMVSAGSVQGKSQ